MRNNRAILFYKFNGTWVLPTQGRTPSGLSRNVEPVLLVEEQDVEGLRKAILEQLANQPAVDEPGLAHSDRRTVPARALKLRSSRAFYDGARAFHVIASPHAISVEEWKKAPSSAFTTPALWKREFGPGDLDEVVWFLVKHEDLAFPHKEDGSTSNERGKGKRGKH